MRLVVFRKVDGLGWLDAAAVEGIPDLRLDPQLLAHPHRQRLHKGSQTRGGDREIRLEDAVEFEDGLVVERDTVELHVGKLGIPSLYLACIT